jgi:hypothetical protein
MNDEKALQPEWLLRPIIHHSKYVYPYNPDR